MTEHILDNIDQDIQYEQEQFQKHRLNKRLAAAWDAAEREDTKNE